MRGSEEEDDQERKGFRVEVDLCLGAMRSLFEKEREGEDKTHNHKRVQRGKRKGTYA